ncbi:M50 family metallopeptidase [Erythrobacter sp. T5W1-R]|uniref:M50 family metallopeptidase n=1 Tax=Erythrobacter sp. T5W1-R TaxID=3101752 RepID=UPI002AFFC040|nr:M50 family metallopeptidase [Erythrobacter sp. T5W1-R]MEA1618963.1 M50 family metallopeptidase [Erythrobacter sp. T5W1-R]
MSAPDFWRVRPGSQTEQIGRLLLAGLVVVFLPSLPFGAYLVYPFVILTTWFHEMGHGLAALAAGQDFQQLMIFANGSGVAQSAVTADAGTWVRVAIAAGGPLGPSVVGALLILASAHQRLWRPTLWLMAGAILASVLLYVRSPTGLLVLPLVAAGLCLVAWRGQPALARFTLQFVGLLAAMSCLRDFDYLFTSAAVVGGQQIVSDTGQIAALTGLPHWLWASVILALSALMIGGSLKAALAERRPKRPANVLQFTQKRR